MPAQTIAPRTSEASHAMSSTGEFLRTRKLMMFVLVGLATGVMLWLTSAEMALGVTAYLVLGIVIVITAIDMFKDLMRGHWGLDILAVIAMIATLAVQEYVAGLIIALMLTGGEALEDLAARRASRELDQLLNRAPAFAGRVPGATLPCAGRKGSVKV
ncbi:hypothetical protein ACQUSY_11895 [Microbacterium sp. YY-03]|uniref:hypothetical protein n=1 Tax=Microbacterium sp. YY-03 TaxID=3421636 RepID=UPI003D1732F7